MNKKLYSNIKEFFLSLLVYIRPNINVSEDTQFNELELEDIDYTLIAIECEESYKVIVDEDKLAGCFFVKDALDYLVSLVDQK